MDIFFKLKRNYTYVFLICLLLSWSMPARALLKKSFNETVPNDYSSQVKAAAVIPAPKSLLVYYGWPSSLNYDNNSWDLNKVSADFAQYQLIVLGAGLEQISHGDHNNTEVILAKINQSLNNSASRTAIFGYLDLGRSTNNFTQAEIEARIHLWQQLFQGLDNIDAGILFDDYGYDFGTDRIRQSNAVNYAKSKNLLVIANAWDPDDVFSAQVNVQEYMGTLMNPDAFPPPQGIDYYLTESFIIQTSVWADQTAMEDKQNKLAAYQLDYPMQVLSLTTNTSGYQYNQEEFNYAWHYASIYKHAAFGWGEPAFSSNAVAPFRARPDKSFYFSPALPITSTDTGPCIYRGPAAGQQAIMIHPMAHIFETDADLSVLLANLNSHFSVEQCQFDDEFSDKALG